MNPYAARRERVQQAMRDARIDALILTPGANMRWLSGFSEPGSRFLALVVPQEGPAVFVTPALNAGQAAENPAGITEILAWDDGAGWEAALQKAVPAGDALALDDEMPARFVLRLGDLFPAARLTAASRLMAPLRAIKDADEIDALRRAAAATDALIPLVYDSCRIGASELEVSLALQQAILRAGHALSFEPIIGAGANGAAPHHHTGAARIQDGDVTVLDFGAMTDGYHGDITRVAAVGQASDEARRVYGIVWRAHQAGVQAVRPGVTAEQVDAAARKVITDAGYGEYFVHRTGHGIGLDDHEAPYIVAGGPTALQPGHCFSIEPGIYLPGRFGVRLENIVTVGSDGTAQTLNEAIPSEITLL